jgi:hypothetical protein
MGYIEGFPVTNPDPSSLVLLHAGDPCGVVNKNPRTCGKVQDFKVRVKLQIASMFT